MTNKQVITRFLQGAKTGKTPTRDITNGIYTYKGNTLYIAGNDLYNYRTIIATRDGNTINLNTQKYSSTTSKIQNELRRTAETLGLSTKNYTPTL